MLDLWSLLTRPARIELSHVLTTDKDNRVYHMFQEVRVCHQKPTLGVVDDALGSLSRDVLRVEKNEGATRGKYRQYGNDGPCRLIEAKWYDDTGTDAEMGEMHRKPVAGLDQLLVGK